jgi:hypothetical protein
MKQNSDRATARIKIMLANAVRAERVIDDGLDGRGHIASLWLLTWWLGAERLSIGATVEILSLAMAVLVPAQITLRACL